MRAVAFAVLVLLLAGCVTPPADVTPQAAPADPLAALPFPDPMGQDHDHSDPALHAFSWGFTQTSHAPVAGSATHSAGVHALDVKQSTLFAAAYGGDADAEGGLYVYDLADPATPKLTGRVRFVGAMGGDRSMEATDDAQFVVMGTETLTSLGQLNVAAPAGMYLIDVKDKASPRIVDFLPYPPFGVHSITIHKIGDKDIVFAGASAGRNVVEIQRAPVPKLVQIGTRAIGHDAVIMDDPIEGKPFLYSAQGGAGFEVYDVSNPAAPQKVAAWNIPDRGDRYYVHQSAVQFIDGKRILVVESEDWEDYASPLWVIDATDLGDMQLLGNWTNPGNHAAEGLRYSMHNPIFVGSTLIVSHYHGGVWALDLSTPEKQARPEVTGVFLPGEPGGKPTKPIGYTLLSATGRSFNVLDTPYTMDVETHEGYVYVADLHTGLYTIKADA